MSNEIEEIGRFVATDGDGDRHTIVIMQRYIVMPANSLSGGPMRKPGLLDLITTRGQHVNVIEKGKYEILGGGIFGNVIATSDDPKAPG